MFFVTYMFVDGIILVRINESNSNTKCYISLQIYYTNLTYPVVGNISLIRVWISQFTLRSCRVMEKGLCYAT